MILAGWSAYPRFLDFERFREIADEVGAYLIVDMAHFAGLVAAGIHPNPVPYADVVTRTVHKTLGGARGGLILCKEEYAKKINSAVFPGQQGGPLEHVIAGKAVALQDRRRPRRSGSARSARSPARRPSPRSCSAPGTASASLTGGTDVHLVLVDLRDSELDGQQAEDRLHEIGITVNRNAVPFDPRPPMVSSGLRVGASALATRGLQAEDFQEIGRDHRHRADARVRRRRAATSPSGSPRSPSATRSTRTWGRRPRSDAPPPARDSDRMVDDALLGFLVAFVVAAGADPAGGAVRAARRRGRRAARRAAWRTAATPLLGGLAIFAGVARRRPAVPARRPTAGGRSSPARRSSRSSARSTTGATLPPAVGSSPARSAAALDPRCSTASWCRTSRCRSSARVDLGDAGRAADAARPGGDHERGQLHRRRRRSRRRRVRDQRGRVRDHRLRPRPRRRRRARADHLRRGARLPRSTTSTRRRSSWATAAPTCSGCCSAPRSSRAR